VSQTIWTQSGSSSSRVRLELTAWRLVESQGVTSTRKLVDSDEEQRVLDALIDRAEPPVTTDLAGLHPLLAAPFRHPPRPGGSRFATRAERGVFYAARELPAFLTEVAYGRFVFLAGTAAHLGPLLTQHTAFQVSLKSSWSVDLTRPPFAAHTRRISSRTEHTTAQQLGREMRDDGIQLVLYESARDPERRTAVAVFAPSAFASSRPLPHAQEWRCLADAETCELRRIAVDLGPTLTVRRADLLVGGMLPEPRDG
jgi:hypothetical protein